MGLLVFISLGMSQVGMLEKLSGTTVESSEFRN